MLPGLYHSDKAEASRLPGYVKKTLTDLHSANVDRVKTLKDKALGFFAGFVIVILIPYLHLGVFYLKIWVPNKKEVNRKSCSCDCFDTVFKGSYETAGSTAYKHVYFNTTETSLKIWILTIFFVLMAYEGVKYLVPLLRSGQLRRGMFLLCLVNVYPQYYSFWMFFNYYNDGFFNYYYHQMFFLVTEMASACMVLHLCKLANEISLWKTLFIVAISTVHVCLAGLDQFLVHVFLAKGTNYQVIRDIGLMAPDVLHIIIPLYALHRHARKKGLQISQLCTRRALLMFLLSALLLIFIGRVILREF